MIYILFSTRNNPYGYQASIAMPTLMFVCLFFGSRCLIAKNRQTTAAFIDVESVITQTIHHYAMITSYRQRPLMCDHFSRENQKWLVQASGLNIFRVNLDHVAGVMGPIMISLLIATKTHLVVSGEMTLGMFVTTMKILHDLSTLFVTLNHHVVAIETCTVALQAATWVLNLSTELKEWKTVNRRRRADTNRLREAMPKTLSQNGTPTFRTDEIEIKMSSLGFHYPGTPWLLKDICVTMKQGQIVGIIGHHGSGKATLMQLLGHSMFPTEGEIFLPCHLRTLYVGQEVEIFETETAWYNLTFGIQSESPCRVKQILEGLGMEATLNLVVSELASLGLEGELDVPFSETKISAADVSCAAASSGTGFPLTKLPLGERAKIHLARALIMNPEVLLLHKPLSHFDEKVSDMLLKALRIHCSNRGYMLPASGRELRRPRTLIISPCTLKELELTNVVWEIKDCSITVHQHGHEASQRWKELFSQSRLR